MTKTRRSGFVVLSGLVFVLLLAAVSPTSAAIYVKITHVPGDVKGYGSGEWFQVNGVTFGVERDDTQLSKAGTSDLNVAAGKLQPISLEKSLDTASTSLARLALTGGILDRVDIHIVEIDPNGVPLPIQAIRLEQAYVRSWSTSAPADGRPTEELLLDYTKIALQTRSLDGSKSQVASWDRTKNTQWETTGDLIGDK